MNNIPVQIKLGIAAITTLLCATACSPLNEPAQTVMTEIAASTESAVHASSEASASESESSSSLSSYISEVSSSESSQTETSETSSEDISSSSDVEATVKAEEIRAAEKAKQEEELRIQQAEQEKARQEAEAALKAEQEKAAANSSSQESSGSQAEKPSTPAEKPAEKPAEQPTQSEPQSNAQQSGKYAVNEYGNPSMEVLRSGVKINVNPADPELQKALGGRGTLDPNVKIPNPWASMQPISPYIGQANPPAAWPKPTPQGHGEYKWSSEAGCWRYYSGGKAYDKYVSIYGIETWAQSKLEKSNPGCTSLRTNSLAGSMGIYGV